MDLVEDGNLEDGNLEPIILEPINNRFQQRTLARNQTSKNYEASSKGSNGKW